jgi:hypothetical protein
MRARSVPALVAAVAATALAGCGAEEIPPPAFACTGDRADLREALRAAPRPVRLDESGAQLSECVRRARSGAQLQEVGLVLTGLADELSGEAAQGDVRSALELGYLVGAARRGARQATGVQDELLRRMERTGAFGEDAPSGVDAAVGEGVAAGEATG